MDAKTESLTRDEVSVESQWDLTGLYSFDDVWNTELTELEAEIEKYASFAGTLGESALKLKACLEFDMNFSRKLEKLYTFSHLKNDEDKTNSLYQGNFEKVMMLVNEASRASSFIQSEIMSIPGDTMQEFLADKELEFYRFHLEQVLRYRDHTLSEKEEALLAASGEMGRGMRDAFDMLDNADLQLGEIEDEDGETVALTHGNFQSLLQSYDRRVRQDAFNTYYKAYESHQYTYSTLLAGSIKKDLFYSRAKNFSSYRAKALFSENIPVEVYDNLLDSVHQNLEPLYKYFDLRKRLLELDELHIYDCNVALVKDMKWHMPFEQAAEEIKVCPETFG